MEISLEIIKELREKTGCGMMDCKAALNETKGNMDKAIEHLRKKGFAAINKRAERVASQGIVESYVHLGGKIGVLVEVNCETDFVARNSDFQTFARDLAMQVAASNPQYINKEEVPADVLAKEKDILRQQTIASGKPANIADKIVEGKVSKFYEEICLMEQAFIKDPAKKIKDLLADLAVKIGENIIIRRFVRYQLGEKS